MISKYLYFNIIIFVLLILTTSVATALLVAMTFQYFYLAPASILIIIETLLLIRYLNLTNRRLAYFVDSIKNEDTSVKLPKDIKNKEVMDLYNGLNHINEIIKQTKIDIEHNEKFLMSLIEHSNTGFLTIDENGNFEVLNNMARKLLNIEYTSNLSRLKQMNPGLHKTITGIKTGETKTHRLITTDRTIELSVSKAEIKYDDQQFTILSLLDITREMEEHELDAWHKIFRVITHEIMNSIAPITSLSNTLIKLFKKNEAEKSPHEIDQKVINHTINGLTVIDEMSKGLMNFVDNYRKLSKIPAPKISEINTQKWLNQLKLLFDEIINNSNIQLKITIQENCRKIFADEKLINQVLINLVQNAVDALADNPVGRIHIQILNGDNEDVLLKVNDNGSGIPEEELDKIFIPFYSTKEKGNGIGLSLTKQIINRHHGSINVHSQTGKGTEVIIRLRNAVHR